MISRRFCVFRLNHPKIAVHFTSYLTQAGNVLWCYILWNSRQLRLKEKHQKAPDVSCLRRLHKSQLRSNEADSLYTKTSSANCFQNELQLSALLIICSIVSHVPPWRLRRLQTINLVLFSSLFHLHSLLSESLSLNASRSFTLLLLVALKTINELWNKSSVQAQIRIECATTKRLLKNLSQEHESPLTTCE